MSTIEKELPFASFSHNLKLFRTERRITLQDLSDATGLSISYLSQLEREEKGYPSADVVYKLCRALKVGFAALLGVVEPPEMAGSEGLRTTEKSPPSVRVRIQVGVNDLGQWCAQGWSLGGPRPESWGEDDGEVRQCPDEDYDRGFLFDGLAEHRSEHVVWIEADVPLPGVVVVEGEVS